MFRSVCFLCVWSWWWFRWISSTCSFSYTFHSFPPHSLPWESEDRFFCPLAFAVSGQWVVPVVDQREGGERSKYLFFWLMNLRDDSDWLWKVHGFLKEAPSMGLSIRVLVTELSHSFGQGYGKSTTATGARALHYPVASLYPIHCFLNSSFVNYLQIYLIWGCSLFSARPVVDTLYVFCQLVEIDFWNLEKSIQARNYSLAIFLGLGKTL